MKKATTVGTNNSLSQNNFGYWWAWLQVIVKTVLLLVGIFGVYRLLFFLLFKGGKGTAGMGTDVAVSFITGFRFDLLIAMYCCLPLVLMSLLILVMFPKRAVLYRVSLKCIRIYLPLICTLVILFCIVDYYFYQFFQSHVNVLFWGIIYDDTKAVTEFIYKDYPVILILLFALGVWLLFYKVIVPKWVTRNKEKAVSFSLLKKIVFGLAAYCLMFLSIRGTFPSPDSFPLRVDDATVSSNTFINTVSLNPLFSLNEAWKDYSAGLDQTDMGKVLSSTGFSSAQEGIACLTGKPGGKLTVDSLFTTTAYNPLLENSKPNVVFIQMESMSNDFIDFHDPSSLNLLGALEEELPDCYLFRNVLPNYNGTHYSLQGFMINAPFASIIESRYVYHTFSSSCALPFYNAGYETHFITGAKLGWRNLGNFVPKQYFTTVEGEAAIDKKVPGTESNEWGAYDEFLFERMLQVLNDTKKPLFLFSMTTTNHPRYFIPDKYKPLPVILNKELKERSIVDTAQLKKNLISYQYANNCLGNFIKRLRNSPAGKNTIVVATGDHNIHGMLNYADADMFRRRSVPIIMYVPDAYKPAYAVDTSRFASHKDIFPTIFAHSLSGARYMNTGNDLLAAPGNSALFFGLNDEDFAVAKDGTVLLKEKLFYQWKSGAKWILEPVTGKPSAALDSLRKKAGAFVVSTNYYLQQEIKK